MSGITLSRAQQNLESWLNADEKLAQGQSYEIAGRKVTRAETLKQIEFWERQVRRLTRGGIRINRAVPE